MHSNPRTESLHDHRMGLECLDTVAENLRIDGSFVNQGVGEREVLRSSGYQLGHHAVMGVQAVSSSQCCIRRFHDDYAFTPSFGQYGGRDADALGVVAECFMKG